MALVGVVVLLREALGVRGAEDGAGAQAQADAVRRGGGGTPWPRRQLQPRSSISRRSPPAAPGAPIECSRVPPEARAGA